MQPFWNMCPGNRTPDLRTDSDVFNSCVNRHHLQKTSQDETLQLMEQAKKDLANFEKGQQGKLFCIKIENSR